MGQGGLLKNGLCIKRAAGIEENATKDWYRNEMGGMVMGTENSSTQVPGQPAAAVTQRLGKSAEVAPGALRAAQRSSVCGSIMISRTASRALRWPLTTCATAVSTGSCT